MRGVDGPQELGADDAARAPDLGDGGEVGAESVLLARGPDLGEALGVGEEERGEEARGMKASIAVVVACVHRRGGGEDLGGVDALLLEGADHARGDGGVDHGDGDAEVHRVLAGPLAGALRLRLVGDHVDEAAAGLLVFGA